MEKFKLMWQSEKKGHCDFCSAELDKKYWIHENNAGEQDFLCHECAAVVLAETAQNLKNVEFENNL